MAFIMLGAAGLAFECRPRAPNRPQYVVVVYDDHNVEFMRFAISSDTVPYVEYSSNGGRLVNVDPQQTQPKTIPPGWTMSVVPRN